MVVNQGLSVPQLRVHRFLAASRANGPGLRAVIWVQGCTLGCAGCFNPQMQPLSGGELFSPDELFRKLLALGDAIEGLTLSGGEPLQQRAALLPLLQRVRRETSLSVLLFTGYTWEALQEMPGIAQLLACVDVLIAGPFEAARPLGHGLLGSANQSVHLLSDRYVRDDIRAVPPTEVLITENGEILLSGVDPLLWERSFDEIEEV